MWDDCILNGMHGILNDTDESKEDLLQFSYLKLSIYYPIYVEYASQVGSK